MRRFAIILTVIACCQCVMAQTHYEGSITIGGKAGAHISRSRRQRVVRARVPPPHARQSQSLNVKL